VGGGVRDYVRNVGHHVLHFLKVLLDWPGSLFTWDILFLIPVPWTGPVLAPMLVSAAMIAAGLWHLRSEARMEPVRIRRSAWAGIVAGAVVIVISFAMDYGIPRTFNWGVFAIGLAIGISSYAWAVRQSRRVDQSATTARLSVADTASARSADTRRQIERMP
jgi:hypothetical protein